MWKIWLTIGVGGIVGFITIFTGLMNQARFAVILYRAVISILLMGGAAFGIAVLGEKFLLPYLLHKNLPSDAQAGKENQPEGDEEKAGNEDALPEEKEQAEFAPFTAENLNRVSPPNS